MHLFVGSTNPVKINAVIIAASETWPEAVVKGFDVPSGIAEQPMTDEETRRGAVNRAERALQQGLRTATNWEPNSALGIGMEGGVFPKGEELWSTVWAVVIDQSGKVFETNGARFKIPDPIAEPILDGQEMGAVIGSLINDPQAKQKKGAIGLITNQFVDRTEEYSGIVKLALGSWFGKNWYDDLHL